ncbi:alpha/beta hydrolase [Salipaludibacillus sp. CUR1]|uniref:alpha/beta fold hydrolase n=1 Tax=Salipaludibacillus sp. CUR1 TaxID=2820003 RepID=UPI001E31C36F|nr:alpha/beta hydrolase [Salipaludibacillus sp. CUR1]MCE7792935.1 alpha/beta hydrolase [Salipaludibacillus sp. CUR1]
MGQQIVTENGRSLYVEDSPGTKGTIIAVHGLTGHHKQFMNYRKALAGTFRFISYDLPGRGNSGPALQDTSIFKHADDLTALIYTLKIERPILMGYSMGAYICALAAANESIIPKALVLLDGAGEVDDTARDLVLPSLDRMKKAYPSKDSYAMDMRSLYRKLNVNWTDRMEDYVRYELARGSSSWRHKSDPALIEKDFESFYAFEPADLQGLITCPVFLLIATGSLAGNRSLFTEKSYEPVKRVFKELQVEKTSQNHYEIVLNNQPDLIERIKNFLTMEGIVHGH